ncbi:MAG: hypothetical protein ISF22_07115 [Methanomassiliicoccus sp.]|nr:hypothetical protein [Methanomassiliicoccus sp.]
MQRTISVRGRPLLLALAATAFMILLIFTPVSGWTGGGGNSNYQAGDCSCHGTVSTATVAMTASSTVLAPGQQVTVTVTVTGGETPNGAPLGAMVLSKLSGSRTMPTDNGWKIVSDSFGTAVNYNEVAYTGSATFTWTLEAPKTPGTYTLYARMENSAAGVAYYKDYSAGLAFTVAQGAGDGSAMLAIVTPAAGSTLAGNVTVDATVIPADGRSIASSDLLIDGSLVGSKDDSPYSWTVDTSSLKDGEHSINVIATDDSGRKISNEVNVTVLNGGALLQSIQQGDWITADIGFLAIVGVLVMAGTGTLRRKKWL